MTTKRKAYVREMKADWWKKLPFYKLYMLRELTAVPTVWICLVMLYGVVCLGSENGFVENFIPFLHNPIVVILNLISLVALMYHAVTLFEMMPPVLGLMHKGERVPAKKIITVMWVVMALISIITLAIAF